MPMSRENPSCVTDQKEKSMALWSPRRDESGRRWIGFWSSMSMCIFFEKGESGVSGHTLRKFFLQAGCL